MKFLRKTTHSLELAYGTIQDVLGLLISSRFLSRSGKAVALLPSAMSLSRIPLGFLLWITTSAPLQALIHIIAGLTDAYDGLLARRLKCTSKIGAVLDPVCDKVYLFWCAAAYWDKLDHFVLGMIVAIEATILLTQVIALMVATLKKIKIAEADLQSTIWGKSKFALECAALLMGSLGLTTAASLLIAIAAIFAIGSIVDYKTKRTARQRSQTQD